MILNKVQTKEGRGGDRFAEISQNGLQVICCRWVGRGIETI
jgi:hypothetical protein